MKEIKTFVWQFEKTSRKTRPYSSDNKRVSVWKGNDQIKPIFIKIKITAF